MYQSTTSHRLASTILTALLALLMILPALPAQASLPPVESSPPNSPYAPLDPSQTRAPGMKTQTPYQVDLLTQALDSPWGVAPLPDGRLVITQKHGSLRIIDPITLALSPAITGFPDLATAGQGGLLDVAPAPDFADSRLLYFSFSLQKPGGALTALGQARLIEDDTALADFRILYEALPVVSGSGHFGSRIAISTEGYLYLSTGDRQATANRPQARSLASNFGKILRLTLTGQPANDNPFASTEGALPAIYSLGHRNTQGLAIHPQTKQLWASEMGPRGGDELNLILPGLDYGWPTVSYGLEYSGAPIGQGLTHTPGTTQPRYYWDPVLAPSGMDFYAGTAIPEWHNNLFIGGLASQHISRLQLDGDKVTGEERLLEGLGQRFRDIAYHPDGSLYAITDQGRLYRVGP